MLSVFVPPSSRRLLPSSLCPSSRSCHRPERDECAPIPMQPNRPSRSSLPQRPLGPLVARPASSLSSEPLQPETPTRPPLHPPSLCLPTSLPFHPSRSLFLPASHTSLGWAEAERMGGVTRLSRSCMRAGTRSRCADGSCGAPSLHCVSFTFHLHHASCLIAGFVLSLRLVAHTSLVFLLLR